MEGIGIEFEPSGDNSHSGTFTKLISFVLKSLYSLVFT